MPFLFTHYLFGLKCLNRIPEEYKKIIDNNIDYFIIGTQGPNILCYHSPFSNPKYIRLSDQIHNKQIYDFLSNSKSYFLTSKNRDSILAYSLGYISHFLLDAYCNNYINKSAIALNVSSNFIKREIENFYLNKDPLNNFKEYIKGIKNTKNITKLVSELLNIKENIIKQSISNMKQYSSLIFINNNKINKLYLYALKLLNKKEYIDCLVFNNQNIEHIAQIIRINKYFDIAVLHYQKLINNYLDYLLKGSSLNDFFLNDFNNLNKQTKILKLDEEKKYYINEYMK